MKKYAVITGASSGIGREIAKDLYERGYALVLVARREERLNELSSELGGGHVVVPLDLRKEEEIEKLFRIIKDYDVEVFVNNAGFGDAGLFYDGSLSKEIDMIDLNVKALHIMMKKALLWFKEKGRGYILNVGSSAGLFPAGPYMATYYASKSYVVSLSMAVAEELRQQKSNIYVGVLCPGPVDTEFNAVAEVEFALNGISARECARYAVKQMFKRKVCIVPTFTMKVAVFFSRFISRKRLIWATARQQKKKIYK